MVTSVVLLEQVKGFAKALICSHELGKPCLSSFLLCGEKDLRERRLIDSAPRPSEEDRRQVLRHTQKPLVLKLYRIESFGGLFTSTRSLPFPQEF